MTPDEHLRKQFNIFRYATPLNGQTSAPVRIAMEEYAKQECIELLNFLMEDERLMEDEGDANELYRLYQQSKQK